MLMRTHFLCFSILFFYLQSFSGIGDWKTFTSKQNVRDIVVNQNIVWAATDGGMFSYSIIDSIFQEFASSEGLKTIDLKSITIDRYGAIWAGASNGYLQSLQPTKSKWGYYEDISILPTPEKAINKLSVFGDTLFICSEIGLSVFKISQNMFGDTFMKYGSTPQISGNVKSILLKDDSIWIATKNGLASAWRYHPNLVAPQSWRVYQTSNGLPSNNIASLAAFSNNIYVGTTNGLAKYNGGRWSTVVGTPSLNILSVASTQNYLYFITQSQLFKLNSDNTVELVENFPSLKLTSIYVINDKIFVGTSSKGIALISDSGVKYILPPGPPSNNLIGLAVDENGDLWAGTGTTDAAQGFVRFDGKTWFQYNVNNYPQLLFPSYYKVDIGRNNTKWVSNWGRGVALLNDQNQIVKVFNKWNGLPPTLMDDTNYVVVAGVVTDRRGKAWINVRTGRGDTVLVGYHADSAKLSYVKTNFKFISTSIAIDMNGTKWLGAIPDPEYPEKIPGLYFYHETDTIRGMIPGTRWGKVSKTNGLSSDNISVVAVDNNGEIWAGTTDAGINIIFDPLNPLNRIAQYNPLRDQKINDILVDPLDQKWVATPKGVYLLTPDGISIVAEYTVKNTGGKLLDDNVISIAMNKKTGVIYFGTDKGLSALQTSSITPAAAFDKILIYPNPYLIPSDNPIMIKGLVRNSTLKILSIDGELVKEITTTGGGICDDWYGRDKNGDYVSSGIYLLVAYSEGGNQIGFGKIAIIRK